MVIKVVRPERRIDMQEKYNVTGMSCAACSSRVEKAVSALPGMKECSVNLLKNSMVVQYDEKTLTGTDIIQAVEKADTALPSDRQPEKGNQRVYRAVCFR